MDKIKIKLLLSCSRLLIGGTSFEWADDKLVDQDQDNKVIDELSGQNA